MSKFSVKKPFTVFVAVIAILVLGVVAFLKMTPDLLPNMNFPYVMIMTTYPGASPEKVEQEITKPLEQAMSTLEHIKEVTSTSSENYSMVLLEFEESANLDVLGVDIQQNLTALSAQWDDMVGAPYVLKINPSLLPVEVAAVTMEGMTTLELTEFLDDTLMNKLEGIPGVARITASGAIHQELHVVLDQDKIDAVNEKIRDAINGKLDDTAQELEEKRQELEDAGEQIAGAQAQLGAGRDQIDDMVQDAYDELDKKSQELVAAREELAAQLEQVKAAKAQLEPVLTLLQSLQDGINRADSRVEAARQELAALQSLQAGIQANDALVSGFEAQIAAIEADDTLTEEEKQAAIANLTGSPEYTAAMAERAQLEAQLSARGLTRETLGPAVAAMEQSMEALEKSMAALEQALADQGLTRETLAQTLAETQAQMDQIDAGIAAMEEGLKQIDEGMLQLEDAEALIEEQKKQGLAQLNNAAGQLAQSSAQIQDALGQIDEGLETLESSRTDALDQADLRDILTMEMVAQILTAQNFAMPAGYLQQDGISYMVSVGENITDLETLQNLLLFDMKIEGVEPIRLGDVAAVMIVDNSAETYAKLNGADGISLSFEKQSVSSTAETTDNINARFRELEKAYPGLKFVALMNQGDYIYLIVETILSSLLLGALFATVILALFLKDLRATFITICSIPVSVIFAFVLMYFSGVTINMISLSGLAVAVGMLVDNSVVVLENIYRLRSKGANAIQAAVSGAKQVAGAVTSSTLTTVCVFAPIVFVEGITRQLFTDLALTMTYALLASLMISLTLVPAMAGGMLKKEKKTKSPIMDRVKAGYGKALAFCLKHRAAVLLLALALLVGSAWLAISRGFSFMPTMDMATISATVSFPEDTSLEDAMAVADEVLIKAQSLPGVETVGASMGSAGASSLLGGGSDEISMTMYIILEDDTASGAAVGRQLEELCRDLPCTVGTSSAMMDMRMLTGSGITLRLYSEDMDALQQAARRAAEILGGVDGIASVSDGLEDAVPALHVAIDRNAAMEKGITVAQVYMELAQALNNSVTPATLELNGTSTDMIIQKPEYAKLDLEGLENYRFTVTGLDGTESSFLLSDIAAVEETASLSSIRRISQRRYLDVTAQLEDGRNVTLVTTQARKAMAEVELGVQSEFTGENDTIMEAVEQLGLMLLLGVLLVYLVMVAQFQSLKSPFIVMFTIPLAFTGGFMGLLLCGMEISVISLIGFIMLTGIIVNNGIVLVDYINQLRMEGAERRAAILEAGQTRMRPILMTSITTILGLIDLAIRQNVGTSMMRPIAVVCIGGLIYATLMTLFVVPCIYDLLNKKELRVVKDEDLKLLDL